MSVDLGPLFAPRRVAVLGVSRSPEKLGHRLLANLLEAEFPGEVFPVNPSGEAILGVKSVPRVADLPEGLDLALVSLPAHSVVAWSIHLLTIRFPSIHSRAPSSLSV